MKSYLLTGIRCSIDAEAALDRHLQGQRKPWVLMSASGDPVAFFDVWMDLDGDPLTCIPADISGRHSGEGDSVLAVLREIQSVMGGAIESSP